MQFHEMLYELDRPELITATQAGLLPLRVAAPIDRMGWRFLRLNLVAMVPGTFATHAASVPAVDGMPAVEPPLEGTYEIRSSPGWWSARPHRPDAGSGVLGAPVLHGILVAGWGAETASI